MKHRQNKRWSQGYYLSSVGISSILMIPTVTKVLSLTSESKKLSQKIGVAKNEELSHLVALVADFEKLDKAMADCLEAGNFEAEIFVKAFSAKMKIKTFLSEQQPINVAPSLAVKLKKIRDNYGYTIDQVIGNSFLQESAIGIDLWEDMIPTGMNYVNEGFFARRNQLGTLIVGRSLPENFTHHFWNLRECYSLGLFEATVIYCRAIIETGCFEALRRQGKINLSSKEADIRERSLTILMQNIKSLIYKANWEAADKMIKQANDILHSKRKKMVISQDQAYDAIKTAFAVIEELFR
jgi:hypothetical protein